MKRLIVTIACILPLVLSAQDFSIGVRIGLNFNSFASPSEVDASGNDLETFDGNTGFLIGATGELEITEIFGARVELLYSQKGGRRKYEGPANVIYNPNTSEAVLAVGQRFSTIRVSNNYIDIPLSAYVKLGNKFRVFGGVNVGFLIGSFGTGEQRFNGLSNNNSTPIEYTSILEHNYLKDEGFSQIDPLDFDMPHAFVADGRSIVIPQTLGAYYLEFADKGDSYFNRLEFGLTGGAAFYMNSALYLSFAVNYGLSDVTNDEYDFSYSETDGLTRIPRADKDHQLSLQTSLGFQF